MTSRQWAKRITLLLALAGAAHAHSLKGLWDGTVKYDDYQIPFLIEFSQKGDAISAAFFNGDEQVTSTAGRLSGEVLNVNFITTPRASPPRIKTESSKAPMAILNTAITISKRGLTRK